MCRYAEEKQTIRTGSLQHHNVYDTRLFICVLCVLPGVSAYTVRFMLASSLANLPRFAHPSIRIRLAPGFVFAAYQFSGNSPSSEKVCFVTLTTAPSCCTW